jgi:hypothetical protein
MCTITVKNIDLMNKNKNLPMTTALPARYAARAAVIIPVASYHIMCFMTSYHEQNRLF